MTMVTLTFDPLPVYLGVAGGIFTVGVFCGWQLRQWFDEWRREREEKAVKETEDVG